MNKNLFRLGASIILFNAIYSLFFVGNFLFSLDLQSIGMTLAFIETIVSFLLLVATGIGLWNIKKWAITTLWIVVALTFIFKIFIFILYSQGMLGSYGDTFTNILSYSWLSIILGILNSIFAYLIIAIFISLEFKERNKIK